MKGIRIAIKYLTIGLLAGLLLAPRKGDETRAILLDRAQDYIKELLGMAQGAADKAADKAQDLADDVKSESQSYSSSIPADGVQ